jgi:hypothetical protein
VRDYNESACASLGRPNSARKQRLVAGKIDRYFFFYKSKNSFVCAQRSGIVTKGPYGLAVREQRPALVLEKRPRSNGSPHV